MKTLSNPTRLGPFADDEVVQVIIETPAGSRNKFAFDPEQGIFALKTTLPAGMTFPYDFGFLPRTIAEDGDPIDVLLLMDEPAFPGILVPSRLIGVIEGEQIDGRQKIRNDRLIAIACKTTRFANVTKPKHLPKEWIHQVESFFVNYHNLEGKKYKLLGCKGARTARDLAKKAMKNT